MASEAVSKIVSGARGVVGYRMGAFADRVEQLESVSSPPD